MLTNIQAAMLKVGQVMYLHMWDDYRAKYAFRKVSLLHVGFVPNSDTVSLLFQRRHYRERYGVPLKGNKDLFFQDSDDA